MAKLSRLGLLMAFLCPASQAGWFEDAGKTQDPLLKVDYLTKFLEEKTPEAALPHNRAAAYHNRGNAFSSLKQKEKALADFEAAIELEESADHYYSRATVLDVMGRHSSAILYYDKALQLAPGKEDFLMGRSLAHLGKENDKAALRDLSSILKANPTSWRARLLRGHHLFKLGRFDQALADADVAVTLMPTDPDGFTLKGEIHAARKETLLAIKAFDSAIGLGAQRTYIMRALAYTTLKKLPLALKDLDQAALLGFANADLYANRSWLHQHLEHFELAEADASKALALDSGDGSRYTLLGQAQFALARYEEAAKAFENATAFNPKSAEAALGAALAAHRLGDKAASKAAWEQAVRLAPGFAKGLKPMKDHGYVFSPAAESAFAELFSQQAVPAR